MKVGPLGSEMTTLHLPTVWVPDARSRQHACTASSGSTGTNPRLAPAHGSGDLQCSTSAADGILVSPDPLELPDAQQLEELRRSSYGII